MEKTPKAGKKSKANLEIEEPKKAAAPKLKNDKNKHKDDFATPLLDSFGAD
jgi:hypothetical protein